MSRRIVIYEVPTAYTGVYAHDINAVPLAHRRPILRPGLLTMARGWVRRAMRLRPIGEVLDTALDPDLRRRIADAPQKDAAR